MAKTPYIWEIPCPAAKAGLQGSSMDRSLLDGRPGGLQNLAEEIVKSQRQT